MKRFMLFLFIFLLFTATLAGCAKSSHYIRKSYQNITTAFLDNDTSQNSYLQGD